MSIKIKQGGAWGEPSDIYVKQDGAWIHPSAVYAKQSGVWIKVWPSNANPLYPAKNVIS